MTIAEAKAWYEQNSNIAFRSSSQKKTAFKIRSLNWNRALNTNDHNYYVAELPVLFDTPPGFTFSDSKTKANAEKANDVARMLILKDQRNGKMRSALMHIVTDNGELDTASTYGKIGANFSGYIFFTKLDGSFINGYEYKNGKIIRKSRKRTSIQKTSKRISMNDALSVMAPPDPGTCITQTTTVYVRYCTYYSNGEKVCTPWEVEDSFETTYCSGGVNDGGSIGGDSYIEQDEPAPIPPSNQDGNIKSIKYEVPNPCITEVYNRIIDHDCQSKIASMLHTFLNSDQINIDISTNNNLGSGVYGQAYGDGDGTNYHVELHTDILAGCSQEFIGMVFYHEAVHVFLKSHQNTWNTTNSSEHQEMLATYFNQISGAITEAYPSMPLRDAYSIILSCINNDSKDATYNDAMVSATKAALIAAMHSKFPEIISEADIITIADQYDEKGSKGTRSNGCHLLLEN